MVVVALGSTRRHLLATGALVGALAANALGWIAIYVATYEVSRYLSLIAACIGGIGGGFWADLHARRRAAEMWRTVVDWARYRRTWLAGFGLAILAIVSLATRLAIARAPGSAVQGADGEWYRAVALYLLHHPNPLDPEWFSQLYAPPGYPAFLAIVFALSTPAISAAYSAQAVIATLIAGTLFVIGARVFDRRVGLIAATFSLISPGWTYGVSLVGYELLLGALIAASYACAVAATTRGPRLALAVAAGLFMWAAIFTQGKVAALVIPLAVFLWRRAARATLLAFLLALLIPTTLWTARNYIVFRQLIPTSVNVGINLWIGNNPQATGGYLTPPPLPGAFAGPPGEAPRLADRRYTAAALTYMRNNPSATTELMINKLDRLFMPLSPPYLAGGQQQNQLDRLTNGWFNENEAVIGLLTTLLGNGLIILFFFIWLWSRPAGWPDAWLLGTSFALFVAVHLPLIAEPRYRISILPLSEVIEAAAVVAIADHWRKRRAMGAL